MKAVTFAAAFVLTLLIVIGGTLVYPSLFGSAVSSNTQYVFGFFLGMFKMLLVLGWMIEKLVSFTRRLWKKKQRS